MKNAWIYKRKNVKGWWCGWYENGKRKAKALPTKALAEHFCYMKYTQLNSDVFTGIVNCEWSHMINEYHHAKRVQGLVEDSIYEVLLTLRHFRRLVEPGSSKDITQKALDLFILERSQEVEKSTINKDIKKHTCISQLGRREALRRFWAETKKAESGAKAGSCFFCFASP